MIELFDMPPSLLKQKISEDIIMIDVRRKDEWKATGIIENVKLLTFFDDFGNHDVSSWLREFQKSVTSKDQEFVLICAHANRTRTIGEYLIMNQGYTNASHLQGGMALWKSLEEKTLEFKS